MKINYVFSILFLLISFLLYKKNDDKVSIVSHIVYTVGLLFCYQVFIVCFLSYIRLGGSLINYSIVNYLISFIIIFLIIKYKRKQLFYFDKKELCLLLLVMFSTFMVVYFRFRGFSTLSYASDDAAIHYRAALIFSKSLEKLTFFNHNDVLFTNFGGMIPISYINGGFFIKIFSGFSSYKVFMFYDGFCFMLSTMLFFVTINYLMGKKYVYNLILSLLYGLGFSLNSFIFGFCYLGLGVIVVQLLIYTVISFKDFSKDIIFKNIILFILLFSVFFSYYLFMPFVYFAMFIYYLLLLRKKEINLKMFFIYFVVTLIIPFIIGFISFFLNYFKTLSKVLGIVSSNGDIYHNASPILFFFLVSYLFILYRRRHKNNDFYHLSFIVFSIYILIFFCLYLFKVVSFYYFYKLFYLYWVYALLFIGISIYKYKKFMYILFFIIVIGCIYIVNNPLGHTTNFLANLNVYYYNARSFKDEYIRFYKEDLDLVDSALKNKDICEYNHEFITIGNTYRNMWFYSIVGSIPIMNHVEHNKSQVYLPNISFYVWEKLDNYPCVLYFNDGGYLDYAKDKYEVLYENNRGLILKKK